MPPDPAQECFERDKGSWTTGLSNSPEELTRWTRDQLILFGMRAAALDITTKKLARYAGWVAVEYLRQRTTSGHSNDLSEDDRLNYWRAVAISKTC